MFIEKIKNNIKEKKYKHFFKFEIFKISFILFFNLCLLGIYLNKN